MADLAKLVVSMEMENAKLLSKLTQSQKRLKKFEKRTDKTADAMKRMGQVTAVAAAAVAGSMLVMAKSTIDHADSLAKLSQTTGLAVEDLSKLEYAAGLSGIGLDTVAKGVAKLQRNMYDASKGLKTYEDAFADLGVSVTESDGSLRDTNDVMLEAADRFSEMEDGAEKAALAQIIFGKAGKDMIPFLNEGAAGIQKMTDKVEKYNAVISTEMAESAENINDNFSDLWMIASGVGIQAMEQIIPLIEEISEQMLAWGEDTDVTVDAVDSLVSTMKNIISAGYYVKGVFEAVAYAGASMAAAAVAAAKGDFSEAATIIRLGAEDSDKAWADAMASIDKVWNEAPNKIKKNAKNTADKIASPTERAAALVEANAKKIKTSLRDMKKDLLEASKGLADVDKDFTERLESLSAPEPKAAEDLTVLDARAGIDAAKDASSLGDFDGAIVKASKAFDMLDKMKEAGKVSQFDLVRYGKELREIAIDAQELKIDNLEVSIEINEQILDDVRNANAQMQAVLYSNPLSQVIKFEGQNIAANEGSKTDNGFATSKSSEQSQPQAGLQPVNITMPGGNVVPMFGDPHVVSQTQRDISREALKRGKR